MIEITAFTKNGGPLTKRISLAADGTVAADGSACLMANGTADRVRLADAAALAGFIAGLHSNQALALGRLRPGLPDHIGIVSKSKLGDLNGAAQPHVIARTAAEIVFVPKREAFVLLDFDRKGMSRDVAARLASVGGLWPALTTVQPELQSIARVTRRSTSSGLFRMDTGERLPGSDNSHTYIAVCDGADVDRFLRTLHDRCWLAGFGWMMVGAGGQLLERSIVDRMVGGPERLVFEGPTSLGATARSGR